MADVYTGADSVRMYLTGSEIHAGCRLSHHHSLGAYRSSVRVQGLGFFRVQAIPNIRIDHVAGYNGVGLGAISIVDSDTITWTEPGGITPGTGVAIANGETKQVCGFVASKFIVVTRTSAAALGGSETVQTMRTVNNVIGCRNFTSAEAIAGEDIYRAVMFVNRNASTITGLKVWFTTPRAATIGSGSWAWSIASETPSSNMLTDKTTDGELSAPSGLSWVYPTTEGTGLSLGNLAADAEMGLWLKHATNAGVGAAPYLVTEINWSFTADGTKYYGKEAGVCRIARDDYNAHEVYRAANADPTISGTPWAVLTDGEYVGEPDDPAIGGATSYHFLVAACNKYGLKMKGNNIYRFVPSIGGQRPTAPTDTYIYPHTDGTYRVAAFYDAIADGDHKATYWRIYTRLDGTNPDPSIDTPVTVAMSATISAIHTLDYASSVASLEDTPIKTLVRVAYVSGASYVESTNTTPSAVTYAQWYGPVRPSSILTFNRALAHHEDSWNAGPDDVITYVDEGENIYFRQGNGYTQFWADTVLIWNLKYVSDNHDYSGLFTTFKFAGGSVSGAATDDAVDTTDWASQILYVAVNGTRLLKIDVANKKITFNKLSNVDAISGTRSDEPAWRKYAHTCFQVWDIASEAYVTPLELASTGVLVSNVATRMKATEAECL